MTVVQRNKGQHSRPQNQEWMKMVWVEYGCPDHGKGPWDGLGSMVKTKVTLDIMYDKERTMTGKITSSILVAQHLRSTFCTKEWFMDHANLQIKEMVAMYQSAEQVIRPSKDIMSSFVEVLCQKTIQLLIQVMLTCTRSRTWIPVECPTSLGDSLYEY
jgi:hypothetical protein